MEREMQVHAIGRSSSGKAGEKKEGVSSEVSGRGGMCARLCLDTILQRHFLSEQAKVIVLIPGADPP